MTPSAAAATLPYGRAATPTVVPCAVSLTGCLGSPASCCSGRRCSTPPTTSGQRRSPEPPPKATRLDPLHPTKNSNHVAEHWSLISGRKSHHALGEARATTAYWLTGCTTIQPDEGVTGYEATRQPRDVPGFVASRVPCMSDDRHR